MTLVYLQRTLGNLTAQQKSSVSHTIDEPPQDATLILNEVSSRVISFEISQST